MPFSIRTNRRRFLAGVAAAGVGGLARPSRALGQNPTPTAPPWLALAADTHISADAKLPARGQVPAENLQAAVRAILDGPTRPEALLIDGDLARARGLEGDYRTLLERLAPVHQAGVPIHLTMGNHDDRGPFRAAFAAGGQPAGASLVEGRQVGLVDVAGLRLILLDSLLTPDSVPGRLEPAQRDWLAKTLDGLPDRPTLLFVHHNLAVGHPGALLDAQELLDLAGARRQVKAIVFGHTHVWSVTDRDGLHLVNLPAVGYPFDPAQPIGWCRLTPTPTGASLDLMPLGAKDPRETKTLRWRT